MSYQNKKKDYSVSETIDFNDQIFYAAVKGDKKAIQRTIKAFTPMVHMWVNKYEHLCPSFMHEDLVQEGVMGILKGIETFEMERSNNGNPLKPSTWLWWKIRAAVQGSARKLSKMKGLDSLDDENKNIQLEDTCSYDIREEDFNLDIEKILIEGCGSKDNKRAQIIKDRYGLCGNQPLRQGEVARKHGLSKQATNGHISKFIQKIRQKYPELYEIVK